MSSKKCDEVAPEPSYIDTIPYTIVDQDGLTSNTAIITVTVLCIRDPPIATPDEDRTNENTPVNVPVLENDYDPANEPIEVTRITEEPEYGTVEIQPDDTITYTLSLIHI